MNGLNQVRGAVIAALNGGGLTAVAAYEGKAKRYPGAVIAVDVAEAAGKAMALCSYLGKTYDESTRTVRSLWPPVTVGISLKCGQQRQRTARRPWRPPRSC